MFRLLLIVPMLLLPSLALADNPAMGPYGSSVVWGPEMSFLPSGSETLRECAVWNPAVPTPYPENRLGA